MKKIVKILLIVLITITLILVAFILFHSLEPMFLDKNNSMTLDEVKELVNEENNIIVLPTSTYEPHPAKSLLFSGNYNQYEFLGRKMLNNQKIIVVKLVNTSSNLISILYIAEETGDILKVEENSGILNTFVEK